MAYADGVEDRSQTQPLTSVPLHLGRLSLDVPKRWMAHERGMRQRHMLAGSSAVTKSAPALATMPIEAVETAGRIDGMVASITSPAVTEPPGLCISQERAGAGCAASRHNNETMLRCAIISGNLRYVSTSCPWWQAVTRTLMGKAGHYSEAIRKHYLAKK